MAITIRAEQSGDEHVIHDLTVAAFATMPYSDGSEAPIIAGLRQDGDLTISLVAVEGPDIEGPDIVGHIAFSPVRIGAGASGGWYGLGPVSVRPDRQRRGIGRLLIDEGLARLRARGAKGCVLVGDPAYYSRFGFRSDGRLGYADLPSRYVQWLSFGDEPEAGGLTFSPAFERELKG